MHVCFAYPFER
jgi:hypothetical protein